MTRQGITKKVKNGKKMVREDKEKARRGAKMKRRRRGRGDEWKG